MRNYERLIKLEEVLSDPKRNKTRQEWIDLYENTYFLSARTFRHDLNQYNLALNERYNNDFGIGQTVIIDYVIKENDRYSVLKDSQGNPYTLYNPVKNLNTEDWHKLANLFAFSSHIIDDGLANRLRALIAYMRAEEDNGVPWKPVSLINDGILAGRDNYSIILSSIQKRQFISAQHHSINQSSKTKKIRLLPLLLKEYSNGWISGWYLLAYEMTDNKPFRWADLTELKIFALDRLERIRAIEDYFVPDPPKGYNPSDYFKDSLGVNRNNLNKPDLAAERIILRNVKGSWIYPYLNTYPIHTSQKIIKNDPALKQLDIELNIEIDSEFKSLLIKYSRELMVVSPVSLKDEIRLGLIDALSNYNVKG